MGTACEVTLALTADPLAVHSTFDALESILCTAAARVVFSGKIGTVTQSVSGVINRTRLNQIIVSQKSKSDLFLDTLATLTSSSS